MSLLLSATKDLLLGMGDQSDNRAVFLNLAQILFAQIISPFQLSLRECLLLRFRPVFVESSLTFFSQMLSPNSLEGTKTSWCFNVSNKTDTDHWWCFNDCNSLNNFFLVKL